MKKVAVFCASSSKVHSAYLNAATLAGEIIAKNNYQLIYGAGEVGLMGNLAKAALANNGHVTGIIPKFMMEMNWGFKAITKLVEVEDMWARKKLMINTADAVIALPGGIGTMDELSEAITLKQLGQFIGPIVILNTLGFFNSLLQQLNEMINKNFMAPDHKHIWTVVNTPEEIIPAILNSPPWDASAIHSAAV